MVQCKRDRMPIVNEGLKKELVGRVPDYLPLNDLNNEVAILKTTANLLRKDAITVELMKQRVGDIFAGAVAANQVEGGMVKKGAAFVSGVMAKKLMEHPEVKYLNLLNPE